MGLFGGSKSGITDADRLRVMELATDEDFTLFEVASRFEDLAHARVVVTELLDKKMVELFAFKPSRERELQQSAAVQALLAKESSWQKAEPGQDKYMLLATDSGWRWHQKHWKAT